MIREIVIEPHVRELWKGNYSLIPFQAGWDALRAREGANTKAEASTLLESCDPFSLREEDAPQSIGQILDRGDSPRDLKERKQWHNSSEVAFPLKAENHCFDIDFLLICYLEINSCYYIRMQ